MIPLDEKLIKLDQLLYFWQQLKIYFNAKVDKVEGKGLSTNDYTTDEKTKLSGIETGANKTVVEASLTSTSDTNALAASQGKALKAEIEALTDSMGELGYGDMMKATYDANNDGVVDDASKLGGQLPAYYAKATDIPTKVSKLENDAGYLTQHQDITGKLDTTGNASNTTVTFTSSSTRTNVATGDKLSIAFGKIAKYFGDLKSVAFTGNYNDLSNKPTIPTVTNDLTNALKIKYDDAYTHSTSAHAPVNAQENKIESITVNGVAQTITSKQISLTIPTTVASFPDAGNYALKTDLTNVYKYKGSKSKVSDLPTTGNVAGDVYNVIERGINYAWTGTEWDALGELFEIQTATNADIDAILAS